MLRLLLCSLGLLAPILALPITKREIQGPVITSDFPDPSIIKVGDTWYAFGTQSVFDYTDIRVQLATSTDFNTWTVTGNDAMGTLGGWVDQAQPLVWAPDVYQREDGSFILYYSATTTTAGNGNFHCVGTAVSDNIEGPYNSNSDTPFACPTDQGGAIDASAFKDDDGTRYVIYKIDGNARGNGGVCGNTEEPIVSTPIMIQQVDSDWTTHIGDPIQILDRGEYDGPLIEGASMVKKDGTYFLFFISNCYSTPQYAESYATSSSPTGGFVKAQQPLLVSGTFPGTFGPGHADVAFDGVHMAFHAYASEGDVGQRRAMYTALLNIDGNIVTV